MPDARRRWREERLRAKERRGEPLTDEEAAVLGGDAWAERARGPH